MQAAQAVLVSSNGGEPVTLAVEASRTVPGSGNLTVGGRQFGLGRERAGTTVTLRADPTVVHLLVNGVSSRPSRRGSASPSCSSCSPTPAGPPPLPTGTAEPGAAIEADRLVNATGLSASPADLARHKPEPPRQRIGQGRLS
jgi:hypothetical protein